MNPVIMQNYPEPRILEDIIQSPTIWEDKSNHWGHMLTDEELQICRIHDIITINHGLVRIWPGLSKTTIDNLVQSIDHLLDLSDLQTVRPLPHILVVSYKHN